jgi:hypothetical protein
MLGSAGLLKLRNALARGRHPVAIYATLPAPIRLAQPVPAR